MSFSDIYSQITEILQPYAGLTAAAAILIILVLLILVNRNPDKDKNIKP